MRRNWAQNILLNSFLNYEILLILISMTKKFSITWFDVMKNSIVWIDYIFIDESKMNYYFHEST
jgi:hypothetical protein